MKVKIVGKQNNSLFVEIDGVQKRYEVVGKAKDYLQKVKILGEADIGFDKSKSKITYISQSFNGKGGRDESIGGDSDTFKQTVSICSMMLLKEQEKHHPAVFSDVYDKVRDTLKEKWKND